MKVMLILIEKLNFVTSELSWLSMVEVSVWYNVWCYDCVVVGGDTSCNIGDTVVTSTLKR